MLQRELARSTDVPLATGENRFRAHEFTELIQEFGVDILTPDTSTCGGLAETKTIANRAEEQYISISPHNVCSPIGTMANAISARPSRTSASSSIRCLTLSGGTIF